MKSLHILLVLGLITSSHSVFADSLYDSDTFKAYASDHVATRVGDSVTILIYEMSSASTNTDSAGQRNLSAGVDFNKTNRSEVGNLDFDVSEEDERGTNRQGNLRARITAVVDEKNENGRLKLSGSQKIIVNGEKQLIKINGWIRPIDISPSNTVLSTRLSDAVIEYKGDNLDHPEGGLLRRVGDIVMWVPKKTLDLTVWLLGVL